MAHIRIVDMPCGYGKSSLILRSFDERQRYIAVVPYMSEVERFIADARKFTGFCLTEPLSTNSSKSDHCEKLIKDGKSIACTHALFYRLRTLATEATVRAAIGTNGAIAASADDHFWLGLAGQPVPQSGQTRGGSLQILPDPCKLNATSMTFSKLTSV